ncbi:MAG: sigma factor-like helix-turn-helix DNA-binding protein [Janthinobacterium lividum]
MPSSPIAETLKSSKATSELPSAFATSAEVKIGAQNPIARRLAQAIDLLTKEEHLVLALYYHEHLTTKEVAAVLGLARFNVLRVHEEAMAKLRVCTAEA